MAQIAPKAKLIAHQAIESIDLFKSQRFFPRQRMVIRHTNRQLFPQKRDNKQAFIGKGIRQDANLTATGHDLLDNRCHIF